MMNQKKNTHTQAHKKKKKMIDKECAQN